MENVIHPDYQHSNLNLIASIQGHFGCKTNVLPLQHLPSDCFQKKNIILLILDGFGENLLSFSPFLKKHQIDTLTTVFPSTTTAAIPSLLSGKLPAQHGALGWSMYFKELVRLIDYLPGKDHLTNRKVQAKHFPIYQLLDFDSIFSELKQVNPDMDVHYYVPKYISKSEFTKKMGLGAAVHGAASLANMLKQIQNTIQKTENRTFHYCYLTNPDSLEHKYGVFSSQVRKFLTQTDIELALFWREMKHQNCEIFITADHGLIDIQEYICLNQFPEIYDAMLYPLFPEGRFASFFVKPHKKVLFRNALRQFENDFIIFSREEFFAKKLLGDFLLHPKIDDFIGDYVAIATGRKAFYMEYPPQKKSVFLKAHHCGLTSAEMQVPLLWISS
jgi:hypothetical protein